MDKKQFDTWNILKQKKDIQEHKPPFVSEMDIWWVHIGENIGYEISGKSKEFSRPVLVYKKLSQHMFLVIPLTSTNKKGSWYVHFYFQKQKSVACLHQIRTIDYRRMIKKMWYKISPQFSPSAAPSTNHHTTLQILYKN